MPKLKGCWPINAGNVDLDLVIVMSWGSLSGHKVPPLKVWRLGSRKPNMWELVPKLSCLHEHILWRPLLKDWVLLLAEHWPDLQWWLAVWVTSCFLSHGRVGSWLCIGFALPLQSVGLPSTCALLVYHEEHMYQHRKTKLRNIPDNNITSRNLETTCY